MASPSGYSKSATVRELELSQCDEHAAVGLAIIEDDKTLSLVASARLHWKIWATCLAAATAGLAFDYDTVVNGASISMPSFLLYFGEIGPTGPYLPSIWTSLWNAMSSLAQVLGSFFVDYLLDRFGRKYTSAATGAFTLLGTGLQYHSTTRGVLLAGKIVNGLGIGAAMATATACASELYFNHASTQNDSDMARSRPSICVGPFNPRRPIQSA